MMNCSSLHRLEHEYYFIYAGKENERTTKKLLYIIIAYNTVKKIKGTLLELFGYRPTAFYNSSFNVELIRKTFGIRIEETDLKVVFYRIELIDEDMVNEDINLIY